ncbi:hypothetical protein [Arthrobacter sp. ok362]|jgi:hypothetical protein|uniref:AMIN-like domain-containing (lipo)protein n=1 Tax=Arthrobacter sp. ok362 TaxID=1761745 RepID=UPI0008830579|nr:hypothetical protein [Arthrobacter sp. ok362]SDK67845.1 hypothetical protein SAMN04487913_102346 [Arthrobacter sp. ok362]
MTAIRNRRTGSRTAGLGTLTLLLVLTACTPPAPQPSAGSQPPSQSPSATAAASLSATGDADETAPPQPGDKVISSTVTHNWSVPGPTPPFHTDHENPVPIAPPPAAPLPTLYAIGAGQHASDTPPYDQLSFRFAGGFPSYDVEMVPELVNDGSGLPIPMPGTGTILEVTFRGAQSHTADGTASTVTSAPAPAIGYQALTSYAPAGDFEGVLSYGIGVGRPMSTIPETKVRVTEVEKIDQGQHLYVVAIQLDATAWK